MLRFVIPKGSLEAKTLEILQAADLPVRRGGERDYHAWIKDPRIDQVRILRPQEIPRFVEEGFFDIGVTGSDWIAETGADVVEVADLAYTKTDIGTKVRIVMAVARDSGWERPEDLPAGVRVSTEYPNLVEAYFKKMGKEARVYLSYGATEAKIPEMADAIVELTETGTTIRQHGLQIIDTLLESTTRLIANRASYDDPALRPAMDELRLLIMGAFDAQGKVLVKFNVASPRLEEVVAILPALKAPTVSSLYGGEYHAVETVVEKAGINLLIPELVKRGAEDILELPINKIIS
ncbi:MAG: ATP phosphoribosyltransferase [Candidatus Geothermincolia bacterium]